MSRAGIQMLAPKPFFSPTGKYVVHSEIMRILGRAASASSVVRAGATAVMGGTKAAVGAPAARSASRAWTRSTAVSTSRVRRSRLLVTPVMVPPSAVNEALTAARSIFSASFLTTPGSSAVSTDGA